MAISSKYSRFVLGRNIRVQNISLVHQSTCSYPDIVSLRTDYKTIAHRGASIRILKSVSKLRKWSSERETLKSTKHFELPFILGALVVRCADFIRPC